MCLKLFLVSLRHIIKHAKHISGCLGLMLRAGRGLVFLPIMRYARQADTNIYSFLYNQNLDQEIRVPVAGRSSGASRGADFRVPRRAAGRPARTSPAKKSLRRQATVGMAAQAFRAGARPLGKTGAAAGTRPRQSRFCSWKSMSACTTKNTSSGSKSPLPSSDALAHT